MLGCCANLKAIQYESTSLNRTVADKSHRVIIAFDKSASQDLAIDNHQLETNFDKVTMHRLNTLTSGCQPK